MARHHSHYVPETPEDIAEDIKRCVEKREKIVTYFKEELDNTHLDQTDCMMKMYRPIQDANIEEEIENLYTEKRSNVISQYIAKYASLIVDERNMIKRRADLIESNIEAAKRNEEYMKEKAEEERLEKIAFDKRMSTLRGRVGFFFERYFKKRK